MTSASNEVLLTEIEGPNGTAEIFEVTKPNQRTIEVEYVVVFGAERKALASMGEAHIAANEMVGIA